MDTYPATPIKLNLFQAWCHARYHWKLDGLPPHNCNKDVLETYGVFAKTTSGKWAIKTVLIQGLPVCTSLHSYGLHCHPEGAVFDLFKHQYPYCYLQHDMMHILEFHNTG